MLEQHPFAQYVRIIGRGPTLSRPLTEDEMLAAAHMILAGQVEPLQLGAFLCILRVRAEVPEEGAGFVRAIRETLDVPGDAPRVMLDWSSYSGKARQLPWFLLAAFTLAHNGVSVAMQGTEGHTEGRIYTRPVLQAMGVPVAGSLAEAADHIRARNFAYTPLAAFSPRLQEIIELKPILGLRSPVNTFARMANPFAAPYEIQTVFHPNYREIHRDTAKLLGQPHMAVFKGEGGEIERRPQKPVVVEHLDNGVYRDEEWPPMITGEFRADDNLDLARLKAFWQGGAESDYAAAAVTGTLAIALRLLGRAASPADALAQADALWAARNRDALLPAA